MSDRNIIVVKLVTSETIVGEESVGLLLNRLYLKNPMVVKFTMSDSGLSGVVLTPYMAFKSGDEISIELNNIICYNKVMDEIEEYYNVSVEYDKKRTFPVMKESIKYSTTYMENSLKEVEEEPKECKTKNTLSNLANNVITPTFFSSNTVN